MNQSDSRAQIFAEIDTSSINQRLLALWSQPDAMMGMPSKRTPLIYPSMAKGALLFVGLNPSYTVEGETFVVGGKEYSYDEHFRWDEKTNKGEFLENELKRLQSRETKYSAPYFKPLAQIAEYCGLPFEHIDLFAVQETNQGNIRKWLAFEDVSGNGWTVSPFAQQQIDIAFDLMTMLEPKLVIVVNALASKLFFNEFKRQGLPMVFDDSLGSYRATLKDRTVPAFFSGMLTGQRALDTFSRERLAWHAKHSISNEET